MYSAKCLCRTVLSAESVLPFHSVEATIWTWKALSLRVFLVFAGRGVRSSSADDLGLYFGLCLMLANISRLDKPPYID